MPSITTVINKLKEADGMIYAAWDLGMQGKNYKDEWASKANSGTLVHSMIHKEEINLALYPEDIIAKANRGYQNYLNWFKQSQLESECSEISLVCECHQCGGTIDDVWIHNGERSIGDIKTGKIYYSHLIQVSAYKHLWEVNFPDKPISGFHLLHFDKETADFGQNYFSNLDEAWEAFIHFRALYDLTTKLKERV